MKTIKLNCEKIKDRVNEICFGDEVLLSGTVYTARDAAHKKIMQLLANGTQLPFELEGATIYYAGPTPEKPNSVCGSFGPTTSSRMDIFTPALLDAGIVCTIGKGPRSDAVRCAIKRNKAIYLCALGGAGALAAKCISSMEAIAFPELGCESVKKLTFKDFPLICGIDSNGNSIFDK